MHFRALSVSNPTQFPGIILAPLDCRHATGSWSSFLLFLKFPKFYYGQPGFELILKKRAMNHYWLRVPVWPKALWTSICLLKLLNVWAANTRSYLLKNETSPTNKQGCATKSYFSLLFILFHLILYCCHEFIALSCNEPQQNMWIKYWYSSR